MLSILKPSHFKASLRQIPPAIRVLAETPAFILKHKLWRGFTDNKGVLIFCIIIAALFSYSLYNNVHDHFITHEKEDEIKPLFSGGLKFLLLVLLEVVIFHFAVKTNNILKDQNVKPQFASFSKAQVRMLKVMGRKWIYVLLIYTLFTILLGIVGLKSLRAVVMFIIYGYYFGFAFFDNYLEQFGLTIKESAKQIHQYFGAATVFGLVASGLILVPLIGPLLAPFLCAVASTRYGHKVAMEEV